MALAAAACAAFVALGNWQAGRADEKRAAAAAVERVEIRGTFVPRNTVLLDNKLHRGRPGYHVLQPMRTKSQGGEALHVLVNRGWIEAGPRREILPAVRTPAGEVVVEGVRLARLPRAYDTGALPTGIVWQNATVESFAAWSGLAMADYIVEQRSPADDGLVREWPQAGAGVDTNRSYSLQWYSLAALTVILLLVLGWRRDAAAAD